MVLGKIDNTFPVNLAETGGKHLREGDFVANVSPHDKSLRRACFPGMILPDRHEEVRTGAA